MATDHGQVPEENMPTSDLADTLRTELREVATTASVPMELWDRFSNHVLDAARALTEQKILDPRDARIAALEADLDNLQNKYMAEGADAQAKIADLTSKSSDKSRRLKGYRNELTAWRTALTAAKAALHDIREMVIQCPDVPRGPTSLADAIVFRADAALSGEQVPSRLMPTPEKRLQCCHTTVVIHCDDCPCVPVDRCRCGTCSDMRTQVPEENMPSPAMDEKTLRACIAMARGYDFMHRTLCNIAGTSGEHARWYVQQAEAILPRITQLFEIDENSNAARPGDCSYADREDFWLREVLEQSILPEHAVPLVEK